MKLQNRWLPNYNAGRKEAFCFFFSSRLFYYFFGKVSPLMCTTWPLIGCFATSPLHRVLKIVSQHANEVAVICLFDAIPTLLLLLVLLLRPESAAKRIDGLLTHQNVFKGPEIQRAAPVANDKTLARGSSLQPQRRAASFSAPWELSRQPSFPQPAKKRERERKTTTRQRIRRHRLRSRNNFYISIRNEVDATLRIQASSVGFGREGLPAGRHWTVNGRNVKLKHSGPKSEI